MDNLQKKIFKTHLDQKLQNEDAESKIEQTDVESKSELKEIKLNRGAKKSASTINSEISLESKYGNKESRVIGMGSYSRVRLVFKF